MNEEEQGMVFGCLKWKESVCCVLCDKGKAAL